MVGRKPITVKEKSIRMGEKHNMVEVFSISMHYIYAFAFIGPLL